MRAVHSANQLIEFELNGVAITVLGLLNQKTIKNVTIVVTVFMTNCHVSLNLNIGPVIPHIKMIKAAMMNAAGWPVARAVHFAKREKGDEE